MDIQDIAHNQPILNVGVIGHVAHGKSTLVKSLSGKATQKFKKELEKNITIKLGYSNAKIFKCSFCPRPKCYQSFYSDAPKQVNCKHCNKDMKLYTHISFVDSPGHQLFLSTMLSGIKCIDAALILIAANEQCPQPQTKEHIAAIDMMGINKSIILQNKVDLVTAKDAKENYESIKNFVTGTLAENSPVIPISAQAQINLDVLCEYICTKFPVPVRDLSTPLTMFILRSFDINKPGTIIDNLKGGVIGGIINTGILRLNDIVEIKPGIIKFDESSKKFTTMQIDEYNTSKKCCNCWKDIENVSINGNKKFRLLGCKSCSGCNIGSPEDEHHSIFQSYSFMTRDKNSCINMLSIAKHIIYKRKRPTEFCRSKS